MKTERLLNLLSRGVVHDQILKDREHVPAIFHHSLEHRAKVRLALTLAIPLRENRRRHSDVPPQFFGVVPSEEEPVEKRGLPLRELEFLGRLIKRIGLCCHGRKGQFTDFDEAVKSPSGAT